LLQESYHSKQIKKTLKEKKESIINPKAEDSSDTDEAFQEVIDTAIEEANDTTSPSTPRHSEE
jgi:thiamine pyrophosphokinase